MKIEDRNAPATNPSWTEIVSHAVSLAVRPHSFANSGAAADALNQSDIASNSATAINRSTRRLWVG